MLRMITLALACIAGAWSQSTKPLPDTVPGAKTPICSAKAICFLGEVSKSKGFRQAINDKLEFVLDPDPDSGWTIKVMSRQQEPGCEEYTGIFETPVRRRVWDEHIGTIDQDSVEEQLSWSPRKFRFVTNSRDCKAEFHRAEVLLWPYTSTDRQVRAAEAKLGSSPLGKGRLWITGSKISHALHSPDNKLGKIEWMRFTVEIKLPTFKDRLAAAARR